MGKEFFDDHEEINEEVFDDFISMVVDELEDIEDFEEFEEFRDWFISEFYKGNRVTISIEISEDDD